MNTFFQKKLSQKWTWRSPNFEKLNEIDYIFTTKISNVSNFKILNKVKGSDHIIVRAVLQIDLQRKRKWLFHSKIRQLGISRDEKGEFKSNLADSFKEAPITTDIDKLNYHFVKVLTKTAEDYRETRDQNNNKLTKPTLDLKQKRKELYIKYNHNKIEYTELNKLFTKKQRKDI